MCVNCSLYNIASVMHSPSHRFGNISLTGAAFNFGVVYFGVPWVDCVLNDADRRIEFDLGNDLFFNDARDVVGVCVDDADVNRSHVGVWHCDVRDDIDSGTSEDDVDNWCCICVVAAVYMPPTCKLILKIGMNAGFTFEYDLVPKCCIVYICEYCEITI